MKAFEIQNLVDRIVDLPDEDYRKVTAILLGGIQGAVGYRKNFNYVGELMKRALRTVPAQEESKS